jgi:single-stranded-DNA-specific exonuclease
VSRPWQVLSGPWTGGGVAERIRRVRGLDAADEVLHDPLLMKDMERAVERLGRALRDGERILVFGDYDADGVTSSALLAQGLRALGGKVSVRLPHRLEEGYGLQPAQMRQILAGPTDLLITADNGTSAAGALALAAADGLDVIVVDHHSPPAQRPPAFALLNPRQADCPYPFKHLAAVGVAFKLLQALDWRELETVLDLAALGTVADVARLSGENRLLVIRGLERINSRPRPGLAALLELPDVRAPEGVDARALGWQLGPRINGAGRLDRAEWALDLLLAASTDEARPLARRLDSLNQERRRLQDEALAPVEKALKGQRDLPALLAFTGARWHLGVIGLVAGKLSQRWERPSLVLTRVLADGRVKGSARSVPGLDITAAITRHSSFLEEFGGHAEAAGLTILEDKLPAFLEALQEDVETLFQQLPAQTLVLDSAVDPTELEPGLLRELAALEPCGAGNPRPRLGLFDVEVERVFRMSGGKHLKLWLQACGRRLEAVWWGHGDEETLVAYGNRLDAAFEPGLNTWNGRTELQLVLEDLRPAEAATPGFRHV